MTEAAKLFIAAQHPLAESIHFQAEKNRLLWVDLLQPALHIHDFATGQASVHPLPLAPPIGSFVLTDDPDIAILAHRQGLSFLHLSTLMLVPFCDPEGGRPDIIYNDIKMDRFGRLWVGTSHAKEKDPRGALWCVTSKGEATLVDVGFIVANGPAFSPDGHTMYFNDSMAQQTLAYDVDPEKPMARNRRVFATYQGDEGYPDGIITDAEGCLWSAQWAGARLIRLAPDGKKLSHHAVPSGHVTTMGFARSTLYITTARDGLDEATLQRLPLSGSVFTLPTSVKGIPEPRFKLA